MTKPAQEKFYQLVGEKICSARKAVGMKQEALASFLELSRTSIVNIEKGRQHPSLYQIREIARLVGVSIESLIPETTALEAKSKSSWQKIINKTVRDKESSEKILGFVTELSSEK
jgi:DNA-binding XRE family transcriptional regulator